MDFKYHFELTNCKKTFLRQSKKFEYGFILDDIKELSILLDVIILGFFKSSVRNTELLTSEMI